MYDSSTGPTLSIHRDPILDWWKRLLRAWPDPQTNTSTFVWLIQLHHCSSLHALRQTATTVLKNDQRLLYTRANLLTPPEAAMRDWQVTRAVADYVQYELCDKYCSNSNNSQGYVYIQTLPQQKQPAKRINNSYVIDTTQDPYGWERKEKESNKSIDVVTNCSLDLLELMNAIKESTEKIRQSRNHDDLNKKNRLRIPVVFESLMPLIRHHGSNACLMWLQHLTRTLVPEVILILTVSFTQFTQSQCECLVDLAHSRLVLVDGEAVWIRPGVRQSEHLLKIDLTYQLFDEYRNNQDRTGIQWSEKGETTKPDQETKVSTTSFSQMNMSNTTTSASETNKSMIKDRKVVLKLEDDDSNNNQRKDYNAGVNVRGTSTETVSGTANAGQPQRPLVIVQDDDPEFDDYDEEDPDDDLDI